MQVINMHLASESEWDDDKEVYYLAVGGDSFVPAQQVELKILKELNTIPFYVFEQPPTEDGFLGVDEVNNTFVFATKHPIISHCYKYFVTTLDELKGKCSYNPYATTPTFVQHFQNTHYTSAAWAKPFAAFQHANWLVPSDAPIKAPPKPKYKWTLTSQGVAFQ